MIEWRTDSEIRAEDRLVRAAIRKMRRDLRDRHAAAVEAKAGDTIACPRCTASLTKTRGGRIFCNRECAAGYRRELTAQWVV